VSVTTFAELLWQRRDDQHGGLRFERRTWSWADVVLESRRRAGLLRQWRAGGAPLHIGVFLENVPDYIFWLGAAALTGDVVVGVNPTRRGAELAQDLRHTDCAALIVEDRTEPLIQGLDLGIASDRILNVDAADYARIVSETEVGGDPVLPEASATFLLLFSSGSTGTPKAVICSQGRLGQLALALGERMRVRAESVTYLCMPLFHGNAIMTNLAPAIAAGATVVLARRFSASGFMRDVREHGVTYWNYVGRALAYVLATPQLPDDADNTLALAYGTEASAADAIRFARRFGCEVMEGYGASEGGLRINRTPDTPEGSLGLPVGERRLDIVDEETLRICGPARFDDQGALLNPEEAIGQMVVRAGASAFEGYYNNPSAMADRVRGEDFWTGDLAYRDDRGFVYFAGRTADWMRVDGENLASAPIERLLQRHSAITQAVVFGVPDAQTGDQVMATVELRQGARLDPDEFARFLEAQPDMGTKWRPRYLRICPELPLTGNGKVARAQIRIEAWYTADPVWVWDRRLGYVELTAERRDGIAAKFSEHSRSHLAPVGARR